jgi:hypothetical protein
LIELWIRCFTARVGAELTAPGSRLQTASWQLVDEGSGVVGATVLVIQGVTCSQASIAGKDARASMRATFSRIDTLTTTSMLPGVACHYQEQPRAMPCQNPQVST